MPKRSVFLIPSDDLGWGMLRFMLQENLGVPIVGEATSAQEAIAAIAALYPDVVLSAGIVEGMPTRELLREFRRTSCPRTRLVVFAAALDPADALPFAEIGLAGHLLWSDLSCATFPSCLATVVTSEMIVASPTVVQAFIEVQQTLRQQSTNRISPPSQGQEPQTFDALTKRQRELLHLVEEGLTDDEIAHRICRSPGTVRKHLQNTYRSLGATNRRTAAHLARGRGWLE